MDLPSVHLSEVIFILASADWAYLHRAQNLIHAKSILNKIDHFVNQLCTLKYEAFIIF